MANINGNNSNNNLVGTSDNDVINGLGGADTMAGSLGDDVYIVENVGDLVVEAVGEGIDTVRSSIDYTLTDNVEKLVLTGTANIYGIGNALDNRLVGNSGDNVLIGMEGNDTLDGGSGSNVLAGGLGDDVYVVGSGVGDIVLEEAGEGDDTVRSSIDYMLTDNVERLVLTGTANITGTGNALDNRLVGNSGDNVLEGREGNDTLIGGGGADILMGGLGDDTYIVDSADGVVIEAEGEGYDTVRSSIDYMLTDNVERLVLTGTANITGTGNALDNRLVGNSGDNTLDGGEGNDMLIGGGGADSLMGGLGDDVYVVDSADGVVIEAEGEGYDTVRSSIDYMLTDNVERLVLTGTANITGTGNALDNRLVGNSGDNVLEGREGNDTLIGGGGADSLMGGLGDDVYVVDSADGVVIEAEGEGYDTVRSSIDYMLTDNVERLVLTGTANITGTGNALDNRLVGNSGDNVLEGREGNDTLIGGGGADILVGGLGDDVYVVDSADDSVTEEENEGIDTVRSNIGYALAANLENLTLTDSGHINGTGNALDNQLIGNNGDNTLDGGEGADIMTGGAGGDTYIVDDENDVVVEQAQATDVGVVVTHVDGAVGPYFFQLLSADGSTNLYIKNPGFSIYVYNADIGEQFVATPANPYMAAISGDGRFVAYVASLAEEGLTVMDTVNGSTVFVPIEDFFSSNGGFNPGQAFGLNSDGSIISYVNDQELLQTVSIGGAPDLVQSSVDFTLSAHVEDLTLTGTANIDGTGNDQDNVITGNDGDNVLTGGLGNDVLTGGLGADVFQWNLVDAGTVGQAARDTVADFNMGLLGLGGDALDLRDLLIDEHHGILGLGNNLDDYLHFESVGADTVVHVSSTGEYATGFDAAKDVQVITLTDIDLLASFVNDQAIIQNLLINQNLITD